MVKTKLKPVWILAGLSTLSIGQNVQAASFQLVPSSSNIRVGDSVNVAVVVSGLGDRTAPSLTFYDLAIQFTPGLLSLNTVVFGDPVLGNQLDLNNLGTSSSFTPSIGQVSISEVSGDSENDLDTLQRGSFTLTTLVFTGSGVGDSNLNLSVTELLNAQLDPLSIDFITGTSITIDIPLTPIPEPSATAGILSLLLGGIFLSRKRK